MITTKEQATRRKKIKMIDLFCGGGGTMEGALQACEEMGVDVEATGFNHWKIAIATSTKNHPKAKHFCMNLDQINPRNVMKGIGKVNLLWASPECTNHSNARGGAPVNDQSRATAMCVVRFAEALKPDVILVENVREFEDWGPTIQKRVTRLVKNKETGIKEEITKLENVPDPKRKGQLFHMWIKFIETIGYRCDWRPLCAADYGDPTSRTRLFVYFVKKNSSRRIIWPEPTHAESPDPGLFGAALKKWVPVKECIDWSILGESIFSRSKPLVPNTINRIIGGIERFGLEPFVLGQQSQAAPRGTESPCPTVSTAGAISLTQACLVKMRGTGTTADVNEPCPTLTAGGLHLALTQAFLTHMRGTSKTNDVNNPCPSITAGGPHLALTTAFLTETNHGNGEQGKAGDKRRIHSVEEPIGAVTGSKGHALVSAHVLNIDHTGSTGACVNKTDEPLTSVTSKQRHALAQTVLIPASEENPFTPGFLEEAKKKVVGFLLKYFGNEEGVESIEDPVDTITTKERFALCRPIIEVQGNKFVFDIFFRMLNEHELQQCQGFPINYKFEGTKKQQIKMIGNAVPVRLAKALVRSAITQKP